MKERMGEKERVYTFDLHVHSRTSIDGKSTPEEIIYSAKKAGLSGLMLTDHDTTAGFEETSALGKKIGIIVIPGAEVTCRSASLGRKKKMPHLVHVLVGGIDPSEKIPSFSRPDEVADWAHKFENGIAIIAHPKKHGGITSMSKKEVFYYAKHFDGIEVANASREQKVDNVVFDWAKELGLAPTGGSDSHKPIPDTIGNCSTVLFDKCSTWKDAVRQIKERKTSASVVELSDDNKEKKKKLKKKEILAKFIL